MTSSRGAWRARLVWAGARRRRCRAYELPVADAATRSRGERWAAPWDGRVERGLAAVEAREADRARRAAATKVDFSTMEVEL